TRDDFSTLSLHDALPIYGIRATMATALKRVATRLSVVILSALRIGYFCARFDTMQSATEAADHTTAVNRTVFPILLAISFSHLLNDMLQSVVPAVYPLIKEEFNLSFTEIGLITLVFQLTASLLQPFVGRYTDKKPLPMSLVAGMAFTFAGLLLFSHATSFTILLVAVGLIGMGSSIFHPESSRVAHMASGGRRGLAQSIFQVGGNTGSAIGPLL